jgi:hypothetical protein
MAPPIDRLGNGKPSRRCASDDGCGARPSLRVPGTRPDRSRSDDRLRPLVGRRVALHASLDQARLQLAQKGGVLGKRLSEFAHDDTTTSGGLGQRAQALRASFDYRIGFRRAHGYFFVGGSSPVVTRQILEAARRATIVAAAPTTAYRPLHITFRSILVLPRRQRDSRG